MRLLLDTHILIAIARRKLQELDAGISSLVAASGNGLYASTASLWEIAIKTRLGKLDPGGPLEDLPAYLQAAGLTFVVIDERHAITAATPEPATRDPFDRMLLSQCVVEGLRLVTRDQALAGHPLAWRPG